MNPKKIAVIAGAVVVVAAGGWLIAKKSGWLGYTGKIQGELTVLSRSPEGPEIPIATDGITVMFNKAVVPLTTLDKGRDKSIPLKITPQVDGKFFWLGTHGFIFRPETPLDPATDYKVTLPAGVVSVDGYKLEKATDWEFATVSPAVLTWEPGDNNILLPKSASFFLRFNLMMNQADVEKKLAVTDETTGQVLLMKRDYVWGDDGHTLRVQFKDELPWESGVKVTLPAGALAKKGTIGTSEPVTVLYKTPAKEMAVEKVISYEFSDAEEVAFKPNQETAVEMGSGVCYHFTQSIDKKSFEKSFRVEPRKVPYFSFSGQEIFTTVDADGKLKDVEGYKIGCISFLDDYAKVYKFSIDPSKIESLSGAKLESGGDTYIAKTRDAGPEIRSLLTKNILSANGPEFALRIPYRGVNLRSATVRLYRITDKQRYDEDVKDQVLWYNEEDAAKKPGPPMATLGSHNFSVPVDAATLTIDPARMPADQTREVPISAAPNVSNRFLVDLATLPQKPGPGLYLLEVIGNPAPGIDAASRKGSGSVYSMIQITPVAVALKRETDHILVWTTDIEKGAPVSSLPVRVMLKKWNSSLGVDETVTEGNIITNEQGVGLLNLATSDELHACAEVTQPGSESYTCESDHKIGGYANLLGPGPHYYTYVYTDRPIYRPGQTVYFSSFIREVREGRYFMPSAGTSAEVTITDSSGQNVFSQSEAALKTGGTVGGQFEIPADEDTPRGDYNLTIQVGAQRFSRVFVVTSYRKPSFKVDLKTDQPEIVSGQEMSVEVQGSYFFGAPLRKAKTTWSIMTSTYLFAPEGFEDFSFIDEDLLYRKEGEDGQISYASEYEYDVVGSSFGGDYESTYAEDSGQYDDPRGAASYRSPGGFLRGPDGKDVTARPETLDEKGLLSIRYKPDLKKYPASQTLSVEANVQDPSHQEVSGAEDVIVHKADFYLGVRPEKWAYGQKETATIDVVSLDTAGKPAGKKSYDVEVVLREYEYIEKRTTGGYWDLIAQPKDTVLKTLDGRTDEDGKGRVSFTFSKGGTYRFVAKGKDGRGNEIQSAATVFAWGEGYVPWKLDEPETVELVPDKDSYRVGETAKILVKSLVPVTKALLTYERGRLLDYKVIDLGGNATHLEIPVTEGMIPNLYVSVIAHVGRGVEAGAAHPPLLYFGETEIHVEPESKRLNIAITPDRTGEGDQPPIYRPGDKVTVKVRTTDPAGKPRKANVIVSVADESVLRLLNYELPDLVKKFYYRRPNAVLSSSSLFSFKAGDSGNGAGKKRRIFKDTAHFEEHLTTDDNGEAAFTFELPDDLTTWVIEALAASDAKSASEFEAERQQAVTLRPMGQRELGADLVLTDNTFVGGNRGKIMTTLPLVLRAALPRFAVWGDQVKGQVIANNRNPREIEGKIKVAASGDASLRGGKEAEEIKFSIPANSEKAYPIDLSVTSAAVGRLTLSIDAKDAKGGDLDALELTLPVQDRYAPEVVASSAMVTGDQPEERERIEIPPDLSSDKGGLDVTFKASIALAAAPSLRNLIYYPYGCSEQKSATLLALLMARDLSQRFGESYFDALAPVKKEVIESTKGLDAKLKLLEDQIVSVRDELLTKFVDGTGGIKYWPDSRKPDFHASVQTLVAVTYAQNQGFSGDAAPVNALKAWLRTELQGNTLIGPDARAFALWGLTLDHSGEFNLTEDVLKEQPVLSATGLSHLLMALKNESWQGGFTDVSGRLLSMAKQEPRHTSWPESDFFSSSQEKNTALAALALLTAESDSGIHPMVPRALAYLLNRKKVSGDQTTQNSLYLSWLVADFAKRAQEDNTNFKASLTAEAKTLLEKAFNRENLLTVHSANVSMKDLKALKQPADLVFKKDGTGTLYYDMVLKYYLPPELTPTREEGLIVSREYYALDDVKEERPLTEFKAGENYKGHIALVVPQDLNYILVQDPLPAGFEPVDMTLATTSRAAMLQAEEGGSDEEGPGGYDEGYGYDRSADYDDVITVEDYGTDYGFSHQEIRDDSIVWSDEYVPAGVYHIRYPVRATTAGSYLMPGAIAFEFYEPEIFGRSRT
ncbi:MAG TPA: MG2 domain-containing protein, partial [bacterium]|nr:MG2 domain-containing protein [bacterium]